MSRTPAAPWRNRVTGSGTLKVAEARIHPDQWRTHPAAQQAALAEVLEEVGWVQNCVVSERTGYLLDGVCRLTLAERRGESEVPCIFVDVSEEEERLILASLDPIGAMASADGAKLQELLSCIQSEDEQMRALVEAIARQERIELPVTAGLVDPDDVPELPAESVSRLGDLWLCGGHRLLCGDATSQTDVIRLMAGERADLMDWDGPYGVAYDGGNHPQTWGSDGQPISPEDKTRHWDSYEEAGALRSFYTKVLRVALACALSETPIAYQWHAMTKVEDVLGAWRAVGLLPHQTIIWHKTRAVLGRSDFMYDFEPCQYGWRAGHRPEPARRPPANATAVWEVPSTVEDGASGVHPTQKSVELLRRPIHWHTKPGDVVFDATLGSGTTVIAAEMTGRRCFGAELAPAFCDVIVSRWQRLTGKEATLEGDGRSFSEIAAERAHGDEPSPDRE